VQGGSRFNIRFERAVPGEALAPAGLERMLARWLVFEQPEPSAAGEDTAALRKGMLEADVDRLLGTPVARSSRTEGALAVTEREYERDGQRVEALFVEGVLVRYTIGSR